MPPFCPKETHSEAECAPGARAKRNEGGNVRAKLGASALAKAHPP